jgi:hypothetical protein
MPTIEPWKILTPEQYHQGWLMPVGPFFVHRNYLVLRRDEHGIVVRNPELQREEELIVYASGQPCGCDYGAKWVCEVHRA